MFAEWWYLIGSGFILAAGITQDSILVTTAALHFVIGTCIMIHQRFREEQSK